jgi:hypothetical protein
MFTLVADRYCFICFEILMEEGKYKVETFGKIEEASE